MLFLKRKKKVFVRFISKWKIGQENVLRQKFITTICSINQKVLLMHLTSTVLKHEARHRDCKLLEGSTSLGRASAGFWVMIPVQVNVPSLRVTLNISAAILSHNGWGFNLLDPFQYYALFISLKVHNLHETSYCLMIFFSPVWISWLIGNGGTINHWLFQLSKNIRKMIEHLLLYCFTLCSTVFRSLQLYRVCHQCLHPRHCQDRERW